MTDPANSFTDYFDSLMRFHNDASKTLTNALGTFTEWHSQTVSSAQKEFIEMERRLTEFKRQASGLADRQRQIEEDLARTVIDYQSTVARGIPAWFDQLDKMVRALPEKRRRQLVLFAEHGWYIDHKMSTEGIDELAAAFAGGEIREAEEALANYFRDRITSLREELDASFPMRTKILEAAFRAHKRGEYELSIPVFLTQVDGIFWEHTEFQMFSRRLGRSKVAEYIQDMGKYSYQALLLHPLSMPIPITKSSGERDDPFPALNRHEVLHGESVEYASEMNSLRCISLLSYIAHVVTYKPATRGEA